MKFKFGNFWIGEDAPCFVIAELSGNHGGSLEKALESVHAIAATGANAIKLQTYRADTMTLPSSKPDFLIPQDNPWASSENLYSLYEKAFTPWEWHKPIALEAKKLGLEFFSSPFDRGAVDLLESLGVPGYKIASPEITDIPLIEYIASKKKPVILSTGMGEIPDIELALKTLHDGGVRDIAILKCTSAYPAAPESMNLRTIPDIEKTFGCVAGLSDHSLGAGIPVAAVAIGARVLEKHFVMSSGQESVDAFFSLDQHGFRIMVDEIRKVEKALGRVTYAVEGESKKNLWARRSLYVSKPIKAGEAFSGENIKSVRPAHGLHPRHYADVVGRKAKKDLEAGDRLSWDVIE